MISRRALSGSEFLTWLLETINLNLYVVILNPYLRSSAANLPVFPSHLTDLLNKTVACIDSASCPKFSKPLYFIIYQMLKSYFAGKIAFGTNYVDKFVTAALKELKHYVRSENQKSGRIALFAFRPPCRAIATRRLVNGMQKKLNFLRHLRLRDEYRF